MLVIMTHDGADDFNESNNNDYNYNINDVIEKMLLLERNMTLNGGGWMFSTHLRFTKAMIRL